MLEVNYLNCHPDAPLRYDSEKQCTLGLHMLVLGVPELTAKNLPDTLDRLQLYFALIAPSPGLEYMVKLFKDSVGVSCNVRAKTWATFVKEQTNHFRGKHV